jgi:2-polyprenyl-6-hydroxyphenyl methylase/3-demethylubiquinone-9 3-methyltransferase
MAAQEKLSSDMTVDPDEIDRFGRLGSQWWDLSGPMRALHRLNPVRVAYLREHLCRHFPSAEGPRDWRSATPLQGLTILDIGCGGGILSEPMARLGARMTSIDPSRRNIEAAKDHAAKAKLDIDYRCVTAEALAAGGAQFDAVLVMEVIEHVRDVRRFLSQAAMMVRPGGMLFAATLNRTWKSFVFGVVGAEYVLGWVPRGTHDWNHFVTPQELASALRGAGLRIEDETGVAYDPAAGKWRLSHDMDINYMMAASRPA